MIEELTIQVPRVAPVGWPVETAEIIHEVWDVFTRRDNVQSVEERVLMAILRSVHDALHQINPCSVCAQEQEQSK